MNVPANISYHRSGEQLWGSETAFKAGLLGMGAPEGADGHAMGDTRPANCRGHMHCTLSGGEVTNWLTCSLAENSLSCSQMILDTHSRLCCQASAVSLRKRPKSKKE